MSKPHAVKPRRDGVTSLQPHQVSLQQAFADKATMAEEQRVSLQELLQHGSAVQVDEVARREHASEAAHQTFATALQQAYEDKAALAATQQVRLRELLHRFRNDLQRVHVLASRNARRAVNTEFAAGFKAIGHHVLSIAALYDHLLGVGMAGTVDLGEYLELLCAKIREAEDFQARHVTLTTDMQGLPLALDTAVTLGVIVNELVANAGKHAFAKDAGGVITVRLSPSRVGEDGSGTLTVADDGRGLGETSAHRHGLDLVRRLVKQAGCELTHEHHGGTVWRIRLP